MQTLGTVALKQLALDEAGRIFEEILPGLERALGATHPDTLRTRHLLAVVARERGELPSARELLEELIEIQAEALGSDHDDHLKSIEVLADLRGATGDGEGAQELTRVLRDVRLQRVGIAEASWVDLREAAELLLQTDDPADAGRALELAHRLTEQQEVFDVQSQQLLARCHAAVGDHDTGREIVENALARLSEGDARRSALEELLVELASE